MLAMSSADYLLFLFCLTITSFEISIHQLNESESEVCNRSDANLVIDSAAAIETESNITFLLFSGEVFYESHLMDNNERPKFEVKKNITEIDSIVSPPIDMSFYDRTERLIGLVNVSTTPTNIY